MHRMHRPSLTLRVAVAASAAIASSSSWAVLPLNQGDPKQQAITFNHIFTTFCVKHIHELKKLSDSMLLSPQLSKEKTALYLQGKPGSVWPVPHPAGKYLLAIRSDADMCTVIGTKADQATVEQGFSALASAPTSFMETKQVQDEKLETPHGPAHTLSYLWSMPGESRKVMLSLTSSNSDTTPVQAVATAAVTRK